MICLTSFKNGRFISFFRNTCILAGFVVFLNILAACKKTEDNSTLTDFDGNSYKTVVIGGQTWMAENLKTTRYNDGSQIPCIRSNNAWKTAYSPAYCWYDNDSLANMNAYGALYSLYTINSSKICPAGWHIPTDAEWTGLFTYLDNETLASNKLKETGVTHWRGTSDVVTNETGFTALPGGYRAADGSFSGKTWYGYWWIANEGATDHGSAICMSYESGQIYRVGETALNAISVRCIKN